MNGLMVRLTVGVLLVLGSVGCAHGPEAHPAHHLPGREEGHATAGLPLTAAQESNKQGSGLRVSGLVPSRRCCISQAQPAQPGREAPHGCHLWLSIILHSPCPTPETEEWCGERVGPCNEPTLSLQYSSIQYSSILYSSIQYSSIQYSGRDGGVARVGGPYNVGDGVRGVRQDGGAPGDPPRRPFGPREDHIRPQPNAADGLALPRPPRLEALPALKPRPRLSLSRAPAPLSLPMLGPQTMVVVVVVPNVGAPLHKGT